MLAAQAVSVKKLIIPIFFNGFRAFVHGLTPKHLIIYIPKTGRHLMSGGLVVFVRANKMTFNSAERPDERVVLE